MAKVEYKLTPYHYANKEVVLYYTCKQISLADISQCQMVLSVQHSVLKQYFLLIMHMHIRAIVCLNNTDVCYVQ